MVVAREAIGPILFGLTRDPAQVTAPIGLPSPSLILEGHIGVSTFFFLREPHPHRIALEAAVVPVVYMVHPHVGAALVLSRRVAGNATLDNDDCLGHVILVDVVDNFHDFPPFIDDCFVALPATQFFAGENAALIRGGSKRTVPLVVLGAVRHRASHMIPQLAGSLETLGLGPSKNCDFVSLLELLGHNDLLPDFPLLEVLWTDPEFLGLLEVRQIEILQVLKPRPPATSFPLPILWNVPVVRDLDGIVAVPLGPLFVGDDVASSLDDQNGAIRDLARARGIR
mmetsp:Transcript_751/g.3064  ORF Transcript_751/g.3064 Transcript_751/m.3064 type:complete len:283 (+) Transcript_751:193-1041(+)